MKGLLSHDLQAASFREKKIVFINTNKGNNMLKMYEDHLKQEGVFNKELSPFMHQMCDTVTGDVSYNMKLSIAVSELMLYASQFRRYIKLPADKTPIPVNSISFVLASSGANKDRTVKAIRSSLSKGYHKIDMARKRLATNAAIQIAKAEGRDEPDKWENHKEFYRSPATLFAAMTNSSAYLDHLADIESLKLGAGFMYTGELGSEMETNADMIPSIRVMSELYDVGYKEAKPLKNKESQTPEIKNLAVSALFIGSHENLLFDEKIKALFKKEFSTKLARRSFFTFSPEEVEATHYDSIKETLRMEQEIEDMVTITRDTLNDLSEKIADCNISDGNQVPMVLEQDAKDIYDIYLRYNKERAKKVPRRFPISVLVRQHAQWKALKLAGALAIFGCHKTITKQDLIYAISYVELIDGDMAKFETELVKEKYEVFSDYMQSRVVDGKSSITLHALKKLQYITGTGAAIKMKELINSASSYDPQGVYSIVDNSIHYETIVKTDVTGASFLEDNYTELANAYKNGSTKDQIGHIKRDMAARAVGGYIYQEVTFPQLSGLLSTDVAFSMFGLKSPAEGAKYNEQKNPHLAKPEYRNLGVRGRENISTGTTWICFDVDNSKLKDEEVHYIIGDINHHIARTSDPDNPYKFRVIVQLDASVNLDPKTWKYFIDSVSEDLGIEIDELPQSQITFGYSGRTVLSVTDGTPIEVKDHLMYAAGQMADPTPKKELTPKEKSLLLSTPFSTFEKAFNAPHGKGSRYLHKAAYKSFKLGATTEETIQLMHEISKYWDYPMPDYRLQALAEQIKQF